LCLFVVAVYVFVCLFVCLRMCMFVCLRICMFVCLRICLFVFVLFLFLSSNQWIYTMLNLHNIKFTQYFFGWYVLIWKVTIDMNQLKYVITILIMSLLTSKRHAHTNSHTHTHYQSAFLYIILSNIISVFLSIFIYANGSPSPSLTLPSPTLSVHAFFSDNINLKTRLSG